MQQRTSAISVLDTSIIGHIKLTLTNWTNTLEPETAAGSSLEIGGSLFYATGNDDLDVAGAWGGIANSTLVYVYYGISGTNTTQELSITAPTWDTAKQGWYNAAMTKRCVATIYKDGTGNYTQKTILKDREISCSAYNDITSYKAGEGAADVLIKQFALAATVPSVAFNIKKPIAGYLTSSGSGANVNLQIQSSTGWITHAFCQLTTPLTIMLNPGTYRFLCAYAFTASLYCLGVSGLNTIIADRIVT